MISIIVPVYNVESYLTRCVESLLTQSEADIEILLVDDGSTDSSGALCDSFAARDHRVRVIHKRNGGLSSARNAGIEAAQGQYIQFLDGDDYLAPNAAQRLMEVASAVGDFDFIQFHYEETDGSWCGDVQIEANIRICTDVREMFSYCYQNGGVAASACTKLYRTSLFDGLRFQEKILHEDEQLLNALLPRCHKVVYTNMVLYGYVMRGGSIIHDTFNLHKLDVLDIMDERIAVLKDLGYTEFIPPTQQGQFRTAAALYCQARRAKDKAACTRLKEKLRILSTVPDLAPGGQYAILCKLTKLTPQAVELYYLIRRICGKS